MTRRRSAADVGLAVVGVVGELLITLGVLLGLFLAWQLWWTDVVADRAQADVVKNLGWTHEIDPGRAQSEGSVAPPTPRRDAPPVPQEPPLLTTFATLHVPRWGADYVRPVSEGVDRETVLNVLGIGHYPGTGMPGAVGNFAIAGHRTTYGKPFNGIADLQPGDPLVVETPDAWYVYRVTSSEIVMPTQVEVIAPVPDSPGEEPTRRMITLTSCHPMFSARERYIVHGELDYWVPADAGVPAELTGAA